MILLHQQAFQISTNTHLVDMYTQASSDEMKKKILESSMREMAN